MLILMYIIMICTDSYDCYLLISIIICLKTKEHFGTGAECAMHNKG